MKKLISIITAFAVVFAMAGFMPMKANAQMCSYTVYVNGSPYSATASYAVSGNLKVNYSTNTVTMNSFYGQSIAAIPNGTVGDDDMPVLNINVSGTNTLTGRLVEDGEYSCIFIELGRSSGEDSEINISGTGTLNLGKGDPEVYSPINANFSGIKCLGNVSISGGATVNINYTVGGLNPTTTPKKTITGIYADNVTVSNSILNVRLDGRTVFPSQYSSAETPTTAPIYGIDAALFQSGNGYTSIDTTAINAQSTSIYSVTGGITINSSNAAVYLKNKKGDGMAVQPSTRTVTNNYSSNVGTYNATGKDFEYKAYVTFNGTNSKLKDLSGYDIYRLMDFGREGEEFRSDSYATDSGKNFYKQYYMKRVDEDGQWNLTEDCYKTSNEGEYLYEGYMRVAPQPGYMLNTNQQTLNSSYYRIAMGQVMNFAPSYTYMQAKIGIISATFLYPDVKITSQPQAYYCKDSTGSLQVGISDITKGALNEPDDYTVDIKYEWHLKATENGTTEDVLVKDVGFATGYDTNTLAIDKSKYAASKVNINGSNVSLADIDKMSIYCAVKSIAGTVKTKEVAFSPFGHIDGEKKIDKKAGFGIEGAENTYCASCDTVTSSTPIPAINEKSVKLKSTTYTYTGKQVKPTVYAKDVNGTSIEASCRNVTYKNNTKVGKATATISFHTAYDASKTMTFKILPKKATLKYATVGKKQVTVKMGTKVSSTGGTKYQIKYRVKGTSTWKTKTTTSQTCTIKSLKKGKKYQIKVRAYKDSYYGEYSAIKTTKAVK